MDPRRNNAKAERELDYVADTIDHKEINSMFGIDPESLYEQGETMANGLGSFGRVFHGDTANAWRYTSGMLPGKKQRYLDHDDYRAQEDETRGDRSLTDLQLPPED